MKSWCKGKEGPRDRGEVLSEGKRGQSSNPGKGTLPKGRFARKRKEVGKGGEKRSGTKAALPRIETVCKETH